MVDEHAVGRVFIGGDMNTAREGTDVNGDLFRMFLAQNKLFSFGHRFSVKRPFTFWRDNQRSWIDHFCASATRKEVLSVRHVIPALDTDHLLVAATLKFSLFVSSQRPQVKDRKMVIPEGAGGSEVERRQLDFALQYNEMVDKLLPPPPSAYVKPEWMSEELWTALRQKHQFYHSSKREEYEMKKRECRKLVKRDRGVYLEGLMDKIQECARRNQIAEAYRFIHPFYKPRVQDRGVHLNAVERKKWDDYFANLLSEPKDPPPFSECIDVVAPFPLECAYPLPFCTEVYTDGSCMDDCAGSGVFFGDGDPRNVSARVPGEQTNNRAEVYAFLLALNASEGTEGVYRQSDSGERLESPACKMCDGICECGAW